MISGMKWVITILQMQDHQVVRGFCNQLERILRYFALNLPMKNRDAILQLPELKCKSLK